MMARRVRYTTVHVSRMKKFHLRPDHLQSKQKRNAASSTRLTVDDVLDRRLVDGKWQYMLMASGNGDEGEPRWFEEAKVLDRLLAPELDMFHAMYELRHEHTMPRHAQRRDVKGEQPNMQKTEALKKFPVGTRVARYAEGYSRNDADRVFEWGVIRGYCQPWWRVRYDNDEWEDLTATQVVDGMQLNEVLKQRGLLPGATGTARMPMKEEPVFKCPKVLGDDLAGKRIRLLFDDGWDYGTLLRLMPNTKELPAKFGKVYEAQFDKETWPRDKQLRRAFYKVTEPAPVGSWHFVTPVAAPTAV